MAVPHPESHRFCANLAARPQPLARVADKVLSTRFFPARQQRETVPGDQPWTLSAALANGKTWGCGRHREAAESGKSQALS